MTKLIILVFLLISYPSFPQDHISLEGNIINQRTNEPVPFAHINVLGSSLGTTSNARGKFNLVIPKTHFGNELKVSCIGFKSKLVKIPSGSGKNHDFTISLEEDLTVLNAVTVISSGNIAQRIIEKAIDNIEINYPDREEKLEGFFRERVSMDSLHANPFYVAEAVVEVNKSAYGQKNKKGDVKLVKGRKYVGPNYDLLQLRFYAGPHHPHRFDFVISRKGPVSKRNLGKYNLQIQDTLRYENKDLIVISFEPEKEIGGSGELYIDLKDYAFVKGVFLNETEATEEILNQFKGFPGNHKRTYRKYITEYAKQDSLWRLKYSEYESAFKKKDDEEVFLHSVFVTTGFDATDKGIPYTERIHFGDIFLEKTGKYEEDFWKGYNIISYESPHQKMSNQEPQEWNNKKRQSRRDRIIDVASKIRTSFGLFYFKSETNPLEIAYNKASLQVNEPVEKNNVFNFGLVSNIGYEISDQWIIAYESSSSFSSKSFSGNSLNIIWEKNLTPSKRPFFLGSGFKVGHYKQRFLVNEYKTDQHFFINNKKFDSNSTAVFVESRTFYLSPFLTLSVEKSGRIRFYADLSYNFPFHKSAGLHFYEKDEFFLKKKNQFLKSKVSDPLIQHTSKSIFKNDYIISLGVKVSI